MIDAVAYGDPETFKGEGTPISGVTLDTSVRRIHFADTNVNSTDFEVVSPFPTKSGHEEGSVSIVELTKISAVKTNADLVGKQVTLEDQVSAVNVKIGLDSDKLVTYTQDATGGIKVVNLDAKKGQRVQVTGTVQSENGLLSLLTQEAIMLDEDGLNLLIFSEVCPNNRSIQTRRESKKAPCTIQCPDDAEHFCSYEW